MKNITLAIALLATVSCATQPRNSEIRASSGRLLHVADFEAVAVGERVHLHQNVCHESKNETNTKTFKTCDKIRVAEGTVVSKAAEGGVMVEMDKDVEMAQGMFFEKSGVTVKNH